MAASLNECQDQVNSITSCGVPYSIVYRHKHHRKFSLRQFGKHIKKTMVMKFDRRKKKIDGNERGENVVDSSDLSELLAQQILKLPCPAILTIKVKPPVSSSIVPCLEDPSISKSYYPNNLYQQNLKPSRRTRERSNSNGNSNSSTTTQSNKTKRKYSLSPSSSNRSEARSSNENGGTSNQLDVPEPVIVISSPDTPNITSKNSSIFSSKHDKESAKVVNTLSPHRPETPSPRNAEKTQKIASKSRQKKFHRFFPQVDENEVVLNYYSCALIAEILLQGHLYITKNYFGFHSNVFGYVTKLLIPIASVLKISKEKTGRIFPNAVGITTEEEKHVFGSLLSRESTYNFLLGVWNSALDQSEELSQLSITEKDISNDLEISEGSVEDNESSSHSENELTITANVDGPRCSVLPKCDDIKLPNAKPVSPKLVRPVPTGIYQQVCRVGSKFLELPTANQFLLASAILLLGLFISAGILLYRIDTLYRKHGDNNQNRFDALTKGDSVYQELFKWQSNIHEQSTAEIGTVLQTNLEQIVKIRQSLHILSQILSQTPKFEENASLLRNLVKNPDTKS